MGVNLYISWYFLLGSIMEICLPSAETLTQEDEHQVQRMMAKRAKIIQELIQTEKDYLNDLELCVREVVQPLRNKQVNATLRVPPAPS